MDNAAGLSTKVDGFSHPPYQLIGGLFPRRQAAHSWIDWKQDSNPPGVHRPPFIRPCPRCIVMKTRNVLGAALLLSAIPLIGCSGPAIVTLKDGRELKTTDSPEYEEETGFYRFERYGRRMRVSEDAILSIRDAD